ncbi:MAG: superoxide dismutase [Bacteroidales bacterium]|nr:superoxide dismutase [Bacteroidales bacterium]
MKTNSYIFPLAIIFLLAGFTPKLTAQNYPFELPKLPYAYNALEPAVDAQTMEIHHSKHHAGYVKNLNAAVKENNYEKYSLDELMLYAGEFDNAIRNNAGGHYNHSLFWRILSLNNPFNAGSEVGKAVNVTFGSLDSLKKLLNKAGATRFGSGWAWLYVTTDLKLAVSSSPNQDNPIMDVSPERGVPILCIDVWEHAYYLKYQNKRGDYLAALIDAVNWEAVDNNYREALISPLLRTVAKETWKELITFHGVMSQTFHPSEEGNLKPIRERSGEFLAKAKALQTEKMPAALDDPEIKKAIGDLIKGAAILNQLVIKKADDKTLIHNLDELHDVFHTIQGLCRH